MCRICVLGMLLFFALESAATAQRPFSGSQDYVQALKKVTDVMVNDVTSPVAASRYYAYLTLAAYEVQVTDSSNSFSGKLNQFNYPIEKTAKDADRSLASIWIIFKTGARLLPSGYMVKPYEDSLLQLARKTVDTSVMNATAQLVQRVYDAVITYSRTDGFSRINNLVRYTPVAGDGYWQPTAPAFMAPVEPHWNTIRPFLLRSPRQFPVATPASYDTGRNSSFFQQMKEVYEIATRGDSSQQQVAMFWDCNPFAVQQMGHVEFGLKKISPGGHWIGIAGIACLQKNLAITQTALVHALLSVGLADAFIACWDEKYNSNRIRPETAINRLMDPKWRPLLQTPPFPEYVSGHSVASTAAAHILTSIFGEQFAYTDNTEVEFELPERRFSNFSAAAKEASISRLYGGIHFRDAIDSGIEMGDHIGRWTTERLAGLVALTNEKKNVPVVAKARKSRR